jgi:hypothetical protein
VAALAGLIAIVGIATNTNNAVPARAVIRINPDLTFIRVVPSLCSRYGMQPDFVNRQQE